MATELVQGSNQLNVAWCMYCMCVLWLWKLDPKSEDSNLLIIFSAVECMRSWCKTLKNREREIENCILHFLSSAFHWSRLVDLSLSALSTLLLEICHLWRIVQITLLVHLMEMFHCFKIQPGRWGRPGSMKFYKTEKFQNWDSGLIGLISGLSKMLHISRIVR